MLAKTLFAAVSCVLVVYVGGILMILFSIHSSRKREALETRRDMPDPSKEGEPLAVRR
jgi:hypothetical protein